MNTINLIDGRTVQITDDDLQSYLQDNKNLIQTSSFARRGKIRNYDETPQHLCIVNNK